MSSLFFWAKHRCFAKCTQLLVSFDCLKFLIPLICSLPLCMFIRPFFLYYCIHTHEFTPIIFDVNHTMHPSCLRCCWFDIWSLGLVWYPTWCFLINWSGFTCCPAFCLQGQSYIWLPILFIGFCYVILVNLCAFKTRHWFCFSIFSHVRPKPRRRLYWNYSAKAASTFHSTRLRYIIFIF